MSNDITNVEIVFLKHEYRDCVAVEWSAALPLIPGSAARPRAEAGKRASARRHNGPRRRRGRPGPPPASLPRAGLTETPCRGAHESSGRNGNEAYLRRRSV